MGSYGDESYTPLRPSSGGAFFKSKSAPPPPTTTSKPPITKKAASVRPPVTTKIARPKGKVNLVFTFDTTGSMGAYRDNFKEKAGYFYEEITKLLPELVGDMEISFVGIGDHCDGNLMIQPTAFSSDVGTLKSHLESIVDTAGGDTPEAFECLFRAMNGWDIEGTNTIVVLATDSFPHGMGYGGDEGCPDNVDWQKELAALKQKIKGFYLVSCMRHPVVNKLQRKLVDNEKYFIELGGNFWRLTNLVQGIIANEVGEIDKFLKNLTKTRGAARAEEVKTLLKTETK